MNAAALDFEVQIHKDFSMLNMGIKYSPFIPIGTSGFRLTPSVKPFLGFSRQTLARFPKQPSDEFEPTVQIENNIYGFEVGAGFAYHWKPGNSVFTEVGYRFIATHGRTLTAPGRNDVTDGIPWSKWAASGVTLRFGIGF